MALDQSLASSQSEPSFSRSDPSATIPINTGNLQSTGLLPKSSSPTLPLPPLSPSSCMESTYSTDAIDGQSPIPFLPDDNGPTTPDADPNAASATQPQDVDPQILEALKSKDRIYVLKLGETFEALIKERRTRVELTPATSYQRLLVHRCSAYYKLAPENDPITKGIFVLQTFDSRIPDRRICDLVPAESTAQPAFKIMRRSAPERRSKPQSQTGSIAGEDADLSDIEPSESGSLGGRSNVTSGSSKKRMTIEEREAAYNKARSRIFMDFEEKEKDMSASSSSLSVVSGSASNSGGARSSNLDTDDAASSPATESEWSANSVPRDKKDNRRGNSGNASASSSRSLRSGGSFHGNGSGSSRNSRAPSPSSSFTYATLYEPPPTGQIYDPSQHHGQPNPGYHQNQFIYPYSPPSQGPSPAYMPPYPYYAPYHNPYQSPPPHAQYNQSDPSTPSGVEPFQPRQMNFVNPYAWPHHPNAPPLQSPPHTMQHPLPPQQQQLQQNPNHSIGTAPPPPQHSPQYQQPPFMHQPHAYTYPMNGYYPPPPPPPGQQMAPPPHMNMHQQQQPAYEAPRPMNGNTMGHPSDGHFNQGVTPRNGLGNGVIPPNIHPGMNGRGPSRSVGPGQPNNNGNGVNGNGVNGNGGKHRLPMPPAARTAWSYGPGIGMGGYVAPIGQPAGDAVGPRLSSNRRPSGNSSSGGNSRSSSNCDEVSSTASSSTTSSSSRRTYTSTTSSQHPLPPRPDWAVGLKAQPNLAGRVHDHSLTNSRTMSPISPPRSNGNHSPHSSATSPRQPPSHNQQQHHNQHFQSQTSPISLQSTDFPPLTSSLTVVQEKRTPVVTGAWGNSRPVLSPTNGNINIQGNGNLQHQNSNSRLEDNERGGFERPVGKSGELFNPKLVRKHPTNNGQALAPAFGHQHTASERGQESANGSAIFVGHISALSLEESVGETYPSQQREPSVVAQTT